MPYNEKLLKAMLGDHLATSDDMVSKFIREIIEDEADIDEVGCILEMARGDIEHAVKKFSEFYAARSESFVDYKVRVGDWCVEWEYIGEGCDGDFDWQDPEDEPRLRANLSYMDIPCNDGSYCTLASTVTSKRELKAAAIELIRQVMHEVNKKEWKERFEGISKKTHSEVSFPDRIMQKWTWREYKS